MHDVPKGVWFLAGAVLTAAAMFGYASIFRVAPPNESDAELASLHAQGISEEPEAIIADLHATSFSGLGAEMDELESILAPR